MPKYMKLVNGKWYSNIRDRRDPKKIHCVSLNAHEHQTRKAYTNLGAVLSDLESGIDPSGARKTIKKIKLKGKVSERAAQVLRLHIIPFFGEMKPREVTREAIESYLEHRFGLSKSGELQAVKSTLDKELNVLQALLREVDHTYKNPKLSYKKIKREILDPLTEEQIFKVSELLAEKYKTVYWIMAYTGMDVSDAVYLKAKHFTKDGWIDKERGKVEHEEGERVVVPVLDELRGKLSKHPRPIDPESYLFPEINSKATTTAILRAFKEAGLSGYGAKYLRSYIGSVLLDLGYSQEWIGKALSHADGSKVTGRYTQVYKTTLGEAFRKIEKRGNKARRGNGS